MNRSLKLPLLIALALSSTQLLAVDLGQIQVKSALGQPLLAEIPVHAATPVELQQLTAQLATDDEFARAGIVGGRPAIGLKFSVATVAGSQPVIRITSTAPVDNPLLDLLVEVNAQSGKSVHEFAILLDPPDMTGRAITAAPAPVQQVPPPAKQPAARSATPAPAPAATVGKVARTPAPTPAPTAPAATTPSATTGEYGPVARGDTLSAIAQAAAPTGVDINQMLLAIKQANPDAFYQDNVNALKAGAILRIPTADEARTIAVAAAIAEVRRQNGDWRAMAAASPATVADTATRASASSAPTPVDAAGDDRLALVPAKAGADASGNAAAAEGGSKGNASAATLRRDLLRAEESLASMQQQAADLSNQVKDLSDINDKNARLLALKDSEIADLQAKLAAARQGTGAPSADAGAEVAPTAEAGHAATVDGASVAGAASAAAPVGAGTAVAPAASGTAGDGVVAAAAVASTVSAPAPLAAASAPVASTTPVAATPAGKRADKAAAPAPVTPWYMQTWAWAAGGGAVLLLLLLALSGRRRKRVVGDAPSSLADRFVAAPGGAASMPGDAEQDELLEQLAERPDDIGLHLELATLYYARRDVEHFEAAAEAMHAHIADPQQDEWQDVLHMGEDLVPGHPLFSQQAEAPVLPSEDPLGDFNLDDYADAPADAADADADTGAPVANAPKPVGGYAFDFDLTAHPVPPPTPPAAEAETDHPLDAAAFAPEAEQAGSVPTPALEADDDTESLWEFEEPGDTLPATAAEDLGEFNDDPVDTKLDLARAYLDMGDAEGARAMLDEVIKEGSQMQQDVARGLLGTLPH